MPKGRWVPCTPAWVAEWEACGATVRRPILEMRGQVDNRPPPYDAVGHEHLMVVFSISGHVSPMQHESGEPA